MSILRVLRMARIFRCGDACYLVHMLTLVPPMGIANVARCRRVLKVGSFAEEVHVFNKGVTQSVPGLTLLCFMLSIYLVVFGAFMNMLEKDAHRNYPCGTVDQSVDCVPEGKDGFESIPSSIWYLLATLTTVGYGDVYPLTPGGKLVGMTCMLTGENL